MELQDLKRWHWICLGLLAGLALGGMRTFWGPEYLHSTARTLTQKQFEEGLLRPTANLRISDLVVHPANGDGFVWVTGTFTDRKSLATEKGDNGPRVMYLASGRFKYRAADVYRPMLWLEGMSNAPTTLRAYLDEISARFAGGGVSYTFAWHEQPRAILAMWTIGAVVLVGGIWPTLIQLMVGAGLVQRKQKQPDYDLDRFAHEAPAAVKTAPQSAADLEAITENMEEQPTGSAEPPTPAVDAATEVPVPVLSGQKLEQAPATSEEEKHYAGFYYPTAAHGQERAP